MNLSLILISLCLVLSACTSSPRISSDHQTTTPKLSRPEPPPPAIVPKATPEKIFEAARKLFDAKEYNKAHDYYLAASNMWRGQPREGEAQVWASRSLLRAGRYHDCAELNSRLLKSRTWTKEITLELTENRLRSLEAINDYSEALNMALEAMGSSLLTNNTDTFRLKASHYIEDKLSVDDLIKVSNQEEAGPLRGNAFFRLGELSLEAKDQESARKYFAKTISVVPATDLSLRAQERLDQLEAVRRVSPKTIGVILPMTGKHSTIAQKTLRGIQMGLGLYNNQPSSFKLAVVDSEGNSDNARRGVERLVKEDNVISIIGSVLSKTAPAVAAKTAELGVPSIALSQKSGITELGNTVFRNSLTSEMQVRYLVKTAMEELGMKKFAILFPNDLYGVEFANIFWDEVLARGGQIVGAQPYSNKETDFREPISRLIGTYYIEGRADEYKLRLKEWSEAQTKKTSRVSPPDDLLPPLIDFDGIFIPDSAKAMGQISAMLSFNRVKGVHLLGTNLWNVPDLAKRAGHFSDSLLFVGSFVGTESHFSTSSFVQNYKSVFGEEPGIFEIQGYDAALLLRQLISQGYSSRETLTSALAQVNNFPGAVGPLSMTSDREIMRPLVALTLDPNEGVIPFTRKKVP